MHQRYSPQSIEKECLGKWAPRDYFSPQNTGNPYCIVLPPPNITGSLHMGHGLQVSLMDASVRYHRMKGHRVLWQGGTDHAGIATQMVVERQLAAKGQMSVKREEFLSAVSAWKEHYEHRINSQLQRLGASIDFSRNRFTFDLGFDKAVRQVLVKLYEEGLLYRGKRLVNWDPHFMTAISDLEVMHTEEAGWLYYLRYPLVETAGYLTVATTRPETLFGDVAVAVHPKDHRYRALINQSVQLPLTNRMLPIIADTEVDPDFGTGCVKVTPAHDFNDYKIGQRHQLPFINILTPQATLNDQVPTAYQGMNCMNARQAVVAALEEQGKLAKKEPHTLRVPRGDRSAVVIEPYLTDQWFIHMKPLAAKAIHAIQTQQVKFIPENWTATCLQWLHHIEDWCISRQLWWGHRMPAWYGPNGECFVGLDEVTIRAEHGLAETVPLTQDEDVLDTWVSAALWPFVTLGWPEQSEVLSTFYPTDVLVTAFDIIPFWVARMLMLGLHFTGKVPFKTVYVTGLIRDHLGQKMSKSKGNVLDPLDVIDGIQLDALIEKRMQGLMQPQMATAIEKITRQQFPEGIEALGADALRMTYYSLASPTRDIRFDMNRTVGYRNFCNKLWQVTRFVCSQYSTSAWQSIQLLDDHSVLNRWILSRLQRVIEKTHQYFANYRFDHLTQLLYDFVWHDYCDWYVELVKPILRSQDAVAIAQTRYTLTIVLEAMIRLLHPLMPFITETLWGELVKAINKEDSQAFNQLDYPIFEAEHLDPAAEETVGWLQRVVKAIRGLRSEIKIPNHQVIPLVYEVSDLETQQRLLKHQSDIEHLTKGVITARSALQDTKTVMDTRETVIIKVDSLTLFVSVKDLMNHEDEIRRLQKEKTRLEEGIRVLENKLANSEFVSKAPTQVVAKAQFHLATHREQLVGIMDQLSGLNRLD
jgi:valyl-tRNA synthetase